MTDRPALVLTVACALGTGLVGGVLFAFSAFVMDGLERLPAPQGIAAMQSINERAVTPMFMFVLFATAAGCVAAAVVALTALDRLGARLQLAAAVIYLGGVIVMTIAFHVPRNDALAIVQPNAPSAVADWTSYVRAWTAGNHVRTLAGLASSALFMLAAIAA